MRAGATVLAAGTLLGAAELGAAVAARRGRAQPCPDARGSRCSAPAMSSRRPASRSGRARSTTPTAPMLVALAEHQGAVCRRAARLPDDRAATEAGPRGRARDRRRGDRLGRRLGRTPRPRQAGARRASASRRSSGGSPSSPASRPGSAAATARWCSASPATRSRPSSPSRCSCGRRCRAPGSDRRAPARAARPCSRPLCARNPDREQAVRVRLERRRRPPAGHPERAAGLPHRHLAARRRRARVRSPPARASSRPARRGARTPSR